MNIERLDIAGRVLFSDESAAVIAFEAEDWTVIGKMVRDKVLRGQEQRLADRERLKEQFRAEILAEVCA